MCPPRVSLPWNGDCFISSEAEAQSKEIFMARVSRERTPTGTRQPVAADGSPGAQEETVARPATEDKTYWTDEMRQEEISRRAYYRAEQRGFAPGYEMEDWLAAEKEVNERMGAGGIG
jgi:hypothetical protein